MPVKKHYIQAPFRLTPSKHFPGELSLECPECFSKNVIMTVEPKGLGTGPGRSFRMGDPCWQIDICESCGATRHRAEGERTYGHRGVTFVVAPDAPLSGLFWHVPLWDQLSRFTGWERSPGAFYNGVEEHPEGAYEWARASACKFIDKLKG